MPIKIKYIGLEDGIHNFHFKESCSSLEIEEPFFGEIEVDCKLDKSPHQLVVDIQVISQVDMECDRCSIPFEAELENNFELVYFFDKDQVDEEDINSHYISPESDEIDLTEDIIDYINLSLPMKKLCSEECKGLCPKCGVNLNDESCNCEDDEYNPVWDELRKLKDKLK